MAINIHIPLIQIFWLFFKDFCKNSTIHGIRYFTVRVRHWSERLWWVIAVGVALWLSTSMIQTTWLEWQNNPTTLSTTNEMNPVSKNPFPTVIICPQTKVVRDKFDVSSKFDSNHRLLANVSHADKERLLKLSQICMYLSSVLPYRNDFADEDIFDVVKDIAPDVEQIALSCSWKGRNVNCSEYLKPFMTYIGVCFAFNGLNSRDIYTDEMAPGAMTSKNNPNVSRWSMEDGYESSFREDEYPIRVIDSDQITTLEINLVTDKRDANPFCQMPYQEHTVYLTAPYEPNEFLLDFIGVELSKDTHILFAPKLTTTSNALRKYSPIKRRCAFQSERRLRFFKTYSQSNCQMECWANLARRFCGCAAFWMPRDKDTKICGTAKSTCFLEALKRMDGDVNLECYCLPACTSTEYSWDIEQFHVNSTDGKHLNKSQQQTRLRVSLQNHQIKTMKRIETMTVVDFLAICGGILGLFMGFSVLSIIELVYYPFLRLCCMVRRMKEEEDEKRSDQSTKDADGTSIEIENQIHSKKWKNRFIGFLRKFLIEFCDNSNIHGVRYLSHRMLYWSERCYWALACIASLLLCGLMTYYVWLKWQSNPALIKPTKEEATIPTIPLPTVTICPEVKATKEKLDVTSALNNLSSLSDIEIQRLNALTNVCPLLPHLVAFEDKFANESIYDTIQDIAPQFIDTLSKCVWNDRRVSRPCSTKMTSILTDEGLCFAFNALNSHDMYTNEMAPGMMMVTGNPNVSHWSLENGYDSDFHRDEYPIRETQIGGNTNSIIFLSIDKLNFEHQCNLFDGGFKLTLTPPGEALKMSRNYFRIQLTKFNIMMIESKMITTLEGLRSYTPIQRQCFYQFERRLRFFKMYTQVNCEEECLANFTSVECGCVHFSMPRDNKTKVCGGASVLCPKAAEEKFLTDKSVAAFHSECNCMPACSSMEYKVKHIDRLQIAKNAGHFLHLKDKRKEIAIVVFTIKNEKIFERVETFTVTDFLAYCGGLLGMFMGISVLSLVEIIYFVTLRLFWIIRRWKSENSVAPLNHRFIEVIRAKDENQ